MHYKILVLITVLSMFGCQYKTIDDTNGFKLKRETYTIEDEDSSRRVITQTFTNSKITYYAYLVKEFDYISFRQIYVYLENPKQPGTTFLMKILMGEDYPKYQNYYLLNSYPNSPNTVYVEFGELLYFDSNDLYNAYTIDYSAFSILQYSKSVNNYDHMNVFFRASNNSHGAANFACDFYLKR